MFKSYLLTAIRNIRAQGFYSFINIGGLAIALAACMMIFLFVRDELSYDNWVPNAERIEKLEYTISIPGRAPIKTAKAAPAIGPAIGSYFKSEIEYTSRALQLEAVTKQDEKTFKEMVTLVDTDFFNIFEFAMANGNRNALEKDPTAIFLSETIAQKYFGDRDPIGQSLTLKIIAGNELADYKVAGVFKDLPHNSHMPFEIITHMDHLKHEGLDQVWGSSWMSATYVKFYNPEDKNTVFTGLNKFATERGPSWAGEINSDKENSDKYNFINIRDIHLYSDKLENLKPGGSFTTVIYFTTAAVLILLIASINFMNLATARALRRAKEVSLRKVLGAKRSQLMKQFLGEAIVTVWVALLLAAVLLKLMLPYYFDFMGIPMGDGYLFGPMVLIGFFGVTTLTGILGGIYPAVILSGYRPSRILGASTSKNKGSFYVRQVLVILQFSISIVLIIATTVVYLQTSMLRTMDRGYTSEHRLALNGMESDNVVASLGILRQEFSSIPGVVSVGLSSQDIPMTYHDNYPFSVPSQDLEEPVDTDRVYVDQGFFEVFDITPIAGRLLSDNFSTDYLVIPEEKDAPLTRGVVVEEQFTKKAGFTEVENAVGEYVILPNMGDNGEPLHATIVGVIPDLELRAMREGKVQTAFFLENPENSGRIRVMTLNIQSDSLIETLKGIDEVWKDIVPDEPMTRYFVDESFDALYNAEQKQAEGFVLFSIFAVFIACLGLFGLAAFAAEQRTKEIGIRKVLGASVKDILGLLNWQFAKPVLLANLIAWPVAYILMKEWLLNFTVRIDLGLMLFAGAGLIALLIAMITVSTQSLKVARAKPIHALHNE
jgi:putative ABC transport system permease protein